MEQKKRKILAGLTVLILAAVACAGAAAYCHYSNDSQQTDSGYSVEFYPADGTTTITLGTSVGVTPPIGEHFDHWNTQADNGGKSYAGGETVSLSADSPSLTLYAIWEVNQYTATMKLDGGSVTGVGEGWTADNNGGHSYSKKFDYGTSVAEIIHDFNATPVKNNHDFSSWSPSTGTLGTSGVVITASYNNHTYSVDRTAHVGEFTTIGDNSNATATYETDYTFTLGVTYTTNGTTVTSNVTASDVKFTVTIGNTDYTDDCISNGNGSYTIKGADITGDITISTTAIHCFSLAYNSNDNSETAITVTYQHYSYDSDYEFTVLPYSEVYGDQSNCSLLWGYGFNLRNGWTKTIWAGQGISLSAGKFLTLTCIPAPFSMPFTS